jgi:asparagine synthase (glutamine-hydrolysing)
MCGIAGWIDWDADLTRRRDTIAAMTDTLAARGLDASGVWLSPRAALGHRRLIVVDPEGGVQPMTRRRGDRSYTIVYNGELYNTTELRQELQNRGHSFLTRSDTEVLLISFIEWGPACVEHLNGIFAFAVWDEANQSLFLARDRLGVKPLFYAQRGSAFLFASELKALLAHPLVEPILDDDGLAEVFVLGPSRTPGHGVFRDVRELRPGYWLLHNGNGTRLHQYWALESRPHTDDLETTTETVRTLVIDAVRRQLVSDVPLATLLSGGLDSSIITVVAAGAFQEEGRGRLHTWSIDYRDNDRYFQPGEFQPNADAPWIQLVSEFAGTHHHHVVIDTHDLVEALTTAVHGRDLPGMADVDASLYLFCREIKKEFTVVLSGECADEIFGGYPWFHQEDLLNTETFPWIRRTQQRFKLLSHELQSRLRPDEYIAERYRQTVSEVPRLPGEDPLEARRREMFYLNLTWFMATLLDRKDRMGMLTGLEARVPYADHRIVEYIWNIPWTMKMTGNREKGILRRAMRGVLPDDVLYRKKSPYPKTHHPAYFRAVRDWVLDILADPTAPLHQVVDAGAVRTLALTSDPPGGGGKPWFGQLMALPQLFAFLGQVNIWLQEYRVTIR